MIYVFTPKSNQRLSKISILTLWCAVWLRGVMHTVELDSAVWCTRWSLTLRYDAHCGAWLNGVRHTTEFLRNYGHLTLQIDAHRGVWLRSVLHTAESDYFENVRFCVFEFVTSFSYVLSKNVWSKKDSLNNLRLSVYCSNILRHHREITIVKSWIKTDTLQVTDSAESDSAESVSAVWCILRSFVFLDIFCHDSAGWCTPPSLIPWYDAHCRAF